MRDPKQYNLLNSYGNDKCCGDGATGAGLHWDTVIDLKGCCDWLIANEKRKTQRVICWGGNRKLCFLNRETEAPALV